MVRPWPALSFVVWFLGQLVITNLAVARRSSCPGRGRRSGRRSWRCASARARGASPPSWRTRSPDPGTLTIDARGRPALLYVHVLSFADVESAVADVEDLERRVVRAFGTADRVAGSHAAGGSVEQRRGGVVIIVALVLLALGGRASSPSW